MTGKGKVVAEPTRPAHSQVSNMRRTSGGDQPPGGIQRRTQPFTDVPDEAITEKGNTGNHHADGGVFSEDLQERPMRDIQDRNASISGRMLAVIVVALVLAIAILTWGPWNTKHVAINPGPSGTPGSTAVDTTPPPAEGPSGTTTGAAR
jgi:hypothetical protein